MMTLVLLILGLLGSQAGTAVPSHAPEASAKQTNPQPTIGPEIAAKLASVKRIYVDSFGDDKESQQLQAMVVDALVSSKRFIVTESKDKADATLKGAGLEKTSQEVHAIGEGTSVGAASGGASASVNGDSGSASGGFIARHLGTEDSQASSVAVNDARLSVRLVSPDGDVLWSTTQESKGAKYKGASADVADQVVKQLVHDLDKSQAPNK